MGEIVNLRRERKRAQRASEAAAAEENRHRFGRTRSQRQAEEIETDRAERSLDGHLRQPSAEPDDRS